MAYASEKSSRKSLIGRMTKKKSSKKEFDAKEDPPTPPLSPVQDENFSPRQDFGASTKDGRPVITSKGADKFRASEVRGRNPVYQNTQENAQENPQETKQKKSSSTSKLMSWRGRNHVVLKSAPPARESAFSGPPRYDWIDIETAAALKVQSVYRRNRAIWELEREGLSTAYMRNRHHQRNSSQWFAASEDVPTPCSFCGLGLLFGDATEDWDGKKQMKRDKFEEKQRKREEKEQKSRSYRAKKKSGPMVQESVEVIE
jgi:hypothetical protein|eukprot:CAMPEP_0198291954 /NCGR_PEP_ID=MMETSP1449-20131203/9282_1 /TAXON_ID=420275 /ORGANISM="Attheya septentrionalis, Strain CCMP2084" /LENGTH=257 /DNA_ID=CAMNT_0043990641 /DNA_START=152 /DNA_END=925 /DNA_ORIENTATION=+